MFEKIAKIEVIVGLCICIAGAFFFIKDYTDKVKKYNDYKAKVEKTLADNEALVKGIDVLTAQQELYTKERNDLLTQISSKNKIIAEKESQIITNNQLVIPSDYDGLKINYLTLFSLYNDQKDINSDQNIQIQKDATQINDLTNKLKEAQNNIITNTQVIEKQVLKPEPFIKNVLLVGGGIDKDNRKSITAGYQAIIRDKFIMQGQVSYPLQIAALVGIKL